MEVLTSEIVSRLVHRGLTAHLTLKLPLSLTHCIVKLLTVASVKELGKSRLYKSVNLSCATNVQGPH
jgi:hypothetical protein